MPSYIDSNLPSYYAEDFPKEDIDLWKNDRNSWSIVREFARINRNKPTVTKMRIMEWAVKGLYNLTDPASFSKAAQIAQAERTLPKEQQFFGNLLAVLKSKVGIAEKDHEQIEEMFKFIIGIYAAKNTDTFNTLLNISVDFAAAHDLQLPEIVRTYDAQHRMIPEVILLHLSLNPAVLAQERAAGFTPLANANLRMSTTEPTATPEPATEDNGLSAPSTLNKSLPY